MPEVKKQHQESENSSKPEYIFGHLFGCIGVLVEFEGTHSILVSTDLKLAPTTIIRLYSYRFKIECTFRTLKQVMGGFCYHFWSKSPHMLEHV